MRSKIINSWSQKKEKKITLFQILLNEQEISRLDFIVSMKDSLNLGFFLTIFLKLFFCII